MKHQFASKAQTLSPTPDLFHRALHTSRNMVMAARGYAELIRRRDDDVERHTEWAARMVDELDRLSDLYSRMGALSAPTTPLGNVPLVSLLQSAERLARRSQGVAGQRIQTRWEVQGDPWVRGAGDDLVLGFAALLENALEASPAGGEVLISVQAGTNYAWVVMIEDEGAGMPAEQVSQLGKPFFSKKPGHVGLGLHLSLTVLDRHALELVLEDKITSGVRAIVKPRANSMGGL